MSPAAAGTSARVATAATATSNSPNPVENRNVTATIGAKPLFAARRRDLGARAGPSECQPRTARVRANTTAPMPPHTAEHPTAPAGQAAATNRLTMPGPSMNTDSISTESRE